jgi:hypothetical protein
MRYLFLLLSVAIIGIVVMLQWKMIKGVIMTANPAGGKSVNEQLQTVTKQTNSYDKTIEKAQNTTDELLKNLNK